MAFTVSHQAPHVDEFLALRTSVGWSNIDADSALKSLQSSLFHVACYHDNKLVAMGRVVGDGFMYFYIQDVVVSPTWQGHGLGVLVMKEIESYLKASAKKGATIGLLAAKGKEAFYSRFAYVERDGTTLGHGMCKFI